MGSDYVKLQLFDLLSSYVVKLVLKWFMLAERIDESFFLMSYDYFTNMDKYRNRGTSGKSELQKQREMYKV